MPHPRMTLQMQLTLRELLATPADSRYGLDLCEATGLPSGTIYPILARLEQLGWVQSQWEDPEAHVHEGRPRRRYYQLTRDGTERARTALAAAYKKNKPAGRIWGDLTPGTPGATQ